MFGSGTYVDSSGFYGIVITNWHVVRDSAGLVQVHFPNGFASYAAIVSYDSTWDLTALMISKPEATPTVSIAKTAPKVGDPLWIAGYGSGPYRLVGGRCTQYITPEIGLRNEFVELSVEARQGDSGGPIFNQKGELAGVLFGSDNWNTAGSFCGRVRFFLEQQSKERIKSAPAEPEKLFASIEPRSPQHKLTEGAELFRQQMVDGSLIYKNSARSDPARPSAQQTYSDPRNGRGSASSREMKPAQTAARPGQLSFYPNFPDFSKNTNPPEKVTQSSKPAPSEVYYNNTVLGPTKNRPNVAENDTYRLSQPNERIAMAVPPPTPTPLWDADADEVLLSESALNAADRPGNFFTTLKIIAAVVVVFFIVFNLVKLMSIIEEN